jgi:ribose 5-phosphate isomerase A
MTTINNPYALAEYLESQVGVVEHGLFLNICDRIIIGDNTVEIKERQQAHVEIN